MFKFKSYNIKKAEGKNEISSSSSKTTVPSYSTGTLKKTTSSLKTSSVETSSYVSPKNKKMPSAAEIKVVSNKQSPDYSRKIYPKKTVTDWHSNKTFSPKKDKETTKVVIPSPHKKLERK